MAELTKFENKLLDDMETIYNDAGKGVSLLRMFISHYDFDMREASKEALDYIQGNWEIAGQALYAITDYFESIEERLEKVLCSGPLTDLKMELEQLESQEEC